VWPLATSTDEMLKDTVQQMSTEVFRASDKLFDAEHPCEGVYIVVQGSVTVKMRRCPSLCPYISERVFESV
jgi:signal-transduction protein with cAMP-binding, CBS, and nucleotidyltransferase domain